MAAFEDEPAALEVPPAWQDAFVTALRAGGPCVILGATDAGKTTFARLLLEQAVATGRPVALLEGDPGQNTLGPPATLPLGLLTAGARWEALQRVGLAFIGATSPQGHLLQTVVGMRRLLDQAHAAGAEFTVVDTSGMVRGGAARALQQHLVAAVAARAVVALARGDELDPLLAAWACASAPVVCRVPPSVRATARSPEQRRARRAAQFRAYFDGGRTMTLPWAGIALQGTAWRTGTPVDAEDRRDLGRVLTARLLWAERTDEGFFCISDGPFDRGGLRAMRDEGVLLNIVTADDLMDLLVGLVAADGTSTGAGLLTDPGITNDHLTVFLPAGVDAPVALILGHLRVAPTGEELGTLRPGWLG